MFLAVVGLAALSILVALGAIVLLIALVSAAGGNDDQAGNVVVLWMAGMGVLLVAVVGAVTWGIVRAVRSGRERR